MEITKSISVALPNRPLTEKEIENIKAFLEQSLRIAARNALHQNAEEEFKRLYGDDSDPKPVGILSAKALREKGTNDN